MEGGSNKSDKIIKSRIEEGEEISKRPICNQILEGLLLDVIMICLRIDRETAEETQYLEGTMRDHTMLNLKKEAPRQGFTYDLKRLKNDNYTIVIPL